MPNGFPMWLYQLILHGPVSERFHCSTSLTVLSIVRFVIFVNLGDMKCYLIEHLFTFIDQPCFFSVKCLFTSFAHFFSDGLAVFFLLIDRPLLYKLDINSLLVSTLQLFSNNLGLLFLLSFEEKGFQM